MSGETTSAVKEPITCHVLNTSTGQPAVGLEVTLKSFSMVDESWHGTTDNNGRIAAWLLGLGNQSTPQDVMSLNLPDDELLWSLQFDAEKYFKDAGVKDAGWWEMIEIRFRTAREGKDAKDHWHVPLLLSPYSYTTYRGS